MTYDIQLERIYAPAKNSDGARVLVDALWPRGKRKDDLKLQEWYRGASPSAKLRRAWHNRELDHAAFEKQYLHELAADAEALVPLMRYARHGRLTLLTATRELEDSHLPTLRSALLAALRNEDADARGNDPSSPVCYGKS